jgi:pyruvate dehydrogenase E2 component (dihydrolipoamide acetyltransferase)
MAEVTMPKLSDTMEEGKILRWLKHAGDRVEVGDLLVEVETDKADMEVEASTSGVLREVKLNEGESAPVGAVIAVIDGSGEAEAGDGKAAARPGREAEQPSAPARDEAPAPRERARSAAPSGARPTPAPRAPAAAPPRPAPTAAGAGPRPAPPRPTNGIKASPLARSLAEQLGVDLRTVRGTGPVGRITRRDVEQASAAGGKSGDRRAATSAHEALEQTRAPETVEGAEPGAGVVAKPRDEQRAAPAGEGARETREGAATPGAEAQAEGGVRRVPLSRMRASIAKRMSESMREAPHFYLTTVVDMDEAVRLREQLKRLELSIVGVTYNHMVLKAVADALVEFPQINARFAGDAIELVSEINLGIATAVEDGLIVPVIRGADRLGLLEIARQARELADKAEKGGFSSPDLSGATFSVSNLGMFDVDSFTAVINPPQAAILAVGSVKQRPIVRDGALAVGHTMSMTLSCDHRVIDGARGGRFLAEVKRRLENPVTLILGGEET